MRKSQVANGPCTEAEVRQVIGAAGAATLIGVIEGGWQAYLKEGKRRALRTRAMIVWEHMIELADRDLLTQFEGVGRVDLPGSVGYMLRDRILLRFKKHDRRFRTSNVPTKVQRVLARQGHFDGMPDLAHITCGYVLDKAEAGIERFVVVRSVRGGKWIIDLKELASGVLAPVQPVLPGIGPAGQVAPLPSIRRRVKADGDGER